MITDIQIPRINANEDEVLLASVKVQLGQQVRPGDVLCSLESTKSAEDLCAASSGYVRSILGVEGAMVRVGASMIILSDAADEALPEAAPAEMPVAAPRLTARQRLEARRSSPLPVRPPDARPALVDSAELDWVVAAREKMTAQGGTWISPEATVSADATIDAPHVFVGAGARIAAGTHIVTEEFILGEGALIGGEVVVDLAGGAHADSRLLVGPASLVGSRASINTCREVLLEAESALSPGSCLFTHGFWQSILDGYHSTFEPIRVCESAWVGAGCQILPGVTVGAGSVVISNSTLVDDLPPECMAGGVPAKVIRRGIKRPLSPEQQLLRLKALVQSMGEALKAKGCPVSFTLEVEETRVIQLSHSGQTWQFDCAKRTFTGDAGDRIAHEVRNLLRRQGIRFRPYAWDAGYRGPLSDA